MKNMSTMDKLFNKNVHFLSQIKLRSESETRLSASLIIHTYTFFPLTPQSDCKQSEKKTTCVLIIMRLYDQIF